MDVTYDKDKRKLLSALSHGSIFFNALVLSAGIPLAIWLVSEDPVTKENAREALNFHLNAWVYSIIFGLLAWLLIGLPLLLVLFLAEIILPIWAILRSLRAPENVFRYPLIFRLL